MTECCSLQRPINPDTSSIKEEEEEDEGLRECPAVQKDTPPAASASPSPSSSKQSWLLRLFESKLFDVSMAISYLYKSKEPGVQAYIGNRLFSFPDRELDFYLPQLLNMYVHMDTEVGDAIRPYLVSCGAQPAGGPADASPAELRICVFPRSTAADPASPSLCCPPGFSAPTPPTCTSPRSATPEAPSSGSSSCLTTSSLSRRRLGPFWDPVPTARCRPRPTGTAGTTAPTWTPAPPLRLSPEPPTRGRCSSLRPGGPTRGPSRTPQWPAASPAPASDEREVTRRWRRSTRR